MRLLPRTTGLDRVHDFRQYYAREDIWDVPLRDLQESAARGCPTCKIHLEAFLQDPEQQSQVANSEEVAISFLYLAKEDAAGIFRDLKVLSVSGRPFEIYTYADDPAARSVSGRKTRSEKASAEAFGTMRYWIDHCFSGHGGRRFQCAKERREAPLPPRLIEIVRNSNNELQAKVVETEGQIDRYVALSYCWGQESLNRHQTTLENYRQHCELLPLGSFAQTVLDAVITTERLGLRYLWVDAVCIIQDSDSDKETQISKMNAIFENSFLTIIAATAENASCGFLDMLTNEKEPVFQMPLVYWGYEPESEDQSDGALPRTRHKAGTVYAMPGDGRRNMTEEPINRRAWTLEERLLPWRKLIFFGDRVAWECDGMSLYDSGEIRNNAEDMRLPTHIQMEITGIYDSPRWEKWAVHEEWLKNVEWYTSRDLTKPANKLRAIGGIAQKYGRFLNMDYLAGIWKGYELHGMLWRRIITATEDVLRPRPAKYRAPTWSWAAIEGMLDFAMVGREEGSTEVTSLGYKQSLATIVKPKSIITAVKLVSPIDQFGGVLAGSIEISGMVENIKGMLEPASHEDLGKVLRMRPIRDLGDRSPRIECWPDAPNELRAGPVELCLLALTGAAEYVPNANMTSTHVIFVVRGIIITSKSSNKYSRVGFFEYWDFSYDRLLEGFSNRQMVIE